jgi:hypothetical protein
LEALKNKAMLLALIDDKEKAAKTAQSYLEMAIPMSKMVKEQRDMNMEMRMKEIEEMGPIQGHTVSMDHMMQQEGLRQLALKPVQAPAPVTHVELTGAALADFLNKKEAAKTAKSAVASAIAPHRPAENLAHRSLPRSRKPLS